MCKLVVDIQDALKDEELEPGCENEIDVLSNEGLIIPFDLNYWYGYLKFFLHQGTCPYHMRYKY